LSCSCVIAIAYIIVFLNEINGDGDWPIASCGLHLDDEAVRVAVALQLGLGLCAAHTCRCGSQVDGYMGHHALNDIISRAFASAKIQVTKEPSGLFRSDGKRPDSLTLIPWQRGLTLTWGVTVAITLADSYISASASSAGATAEMAASRFQKTSQVCRIVRNVRVPADCFGNFGLNQRIGCAEI